VVHVSVWLKRWWSIVCSKWELPNVHALHIRVVYAVQCQQEDSCLQCDGCEAWMHISCMKLIISVMFTAYYLMHSFTVCLVRWIQVLSLSVTNCSLCSTGCKNAAASREWAAAAIILPLCTAGVFAAVSGSGHSWCCVWGFAVEAQSFVLQVMGTACSWLCLSPCTVVVNSLTTWPVCQVNKVPSVPSCFRMTPSGDCYFWFVE